MPLPRMYLHLHNHHRAHLACCTLHTSALEHLLPPMQPAEPLGRAQRGEAAKATLPAAEAVPSLCDHHAASGAETPPPLNTGCPAKCSTLKPLTKRRGEAAGAALLTLSLYNLYGHHLPCGGWHAARGHAATFEHLM